MKNKINILLIFLSFFLGSFCMFFMILFTKKDCEVCEECKEIQLGEKVEFPIDEQNVFDLLYDYGSKIYEKKEYNNLNKNSDGIYYATLNDISKLNYDVSSLSHCAQNYPLVYFDINNKIVDKYEGYPIQIVIKCTRE